jgi:hypothetical protein
LRIFYLAAFLALTPLLAQIQTLVGATRQQIYALYGEPTNRLTVGTKEVLTYKHGRVVLENGLVVEITLPLPTQLLQKPAPKPVPPSSVAPVRSRAPTNTPLMSDDARQVSAPHPIARPLPQNGQVAMQSAFNRVVGYGVLFALVGIAGAALAAWLTSRRPSLSDQLLEKRSKAPSAVSPTLLKMPPVRASLPSSPTRLTAELLNQLEWRRFEVLVTAYFNNTGIRATRSRVGADGGVDIYLYRDGEGRPCSYVQCKAWHVYKVGVKPVRELFGVMAAEGINEGYFATTGQFTEEAERFATGKSLRLLTGERIIEMVNALPGDRLLTLLREITDGDYTTPTCPRCDIKMVRRSGENGEFWGCPNYKSRPSCRQTFKLREEEET